MIMEAQPTDRPPQRPGATRVPFFVPLFNPIARRLLGAGFPMGPNALLCVEPLQLRSSSSAGVAG
jgi:hypothetical protein